MATSTIQVSAIPLGPQRSKSKSRASKISTTSKTSTTPSQRYYLQKYEDITRERLSIEDSQLPEDHLEDLVALPIAPELVPRRSRSKISLGSTAEDGSRHASIPLPTPPNEYSQSLQFMDTNSYKKDDNYLRSRALSAPFEMNSDVRLYVTGPDQTGNGTNPRTSGYGSKQPSSLSDKENKVSTGMVKSKSNSSATSSSVTSNSATSGPSSPTMEDTPRNRGAPDRSVSSRRQLSASSGPATSTPKRTPKASSPEIVTRTPSRRTSPAQKKSATSPLSTPSSRPRTNSTPLLSNSSSSKANRNYTTDARPPWLDEEPTYLYKSDVLSASPGSLAHIALQAKSKASSPPPNSEEADESFDIGNQIGNTSIRSWDDVILPTVAKQIRSQQILDAQQQPDEPLVPLTEGGFIDGDYEFLVTDYNPDGTPKKWKKITMKQRQVLQAEKKKEAEEEEARKKAEEEERGVQLANAPSGLSPPSPKEIDRRTSRRSLMDRSSHEQFEFASYGLAAQPSPDRPTASTGTGRTEVWQQEGLASPGIAKRNGFGSQYNPQTFGSAYEMSVARGLGSEKSKRPAEPVGIDDDGNHTGGCKCIIM